MKNHKSLPVPVLDKVGQLQPSESEHSLGGQSSSEPVKQEGQKALIEEALEALETLSPFYRRGPVWDTARIGETIVKLQTFLSEHDVSEHATSVSSPESPAASLSAGVKEQDFQKFFECIDAAIKRITSGQAAMRIPVDFTDPDVVLAECKLSIAALRERITQLETINEPFTGEPNCD